MKHSAQYAHLHIYHAAAQEIPGRFCTQKKVDIALIIASFAGLLSAIVFLITMV